MSTWEERLRNLAHGGDSWDLPSQAELDSALSNLRPILTRASSDHGLTGATGLAASESMAQAATEAARVEQYLAQVKEFVSQANRIRNLASDRLQALGTGQLDSGQEAIVRGATAGATIWMGPISFVAGEGAVQAMNWFLGSQREEQSKAAVAEVSDALDALPEPNPLPAPPVLDGAKSDVEQGSTDPSPVPVPGEGSRSVDNYPDFGAPPASPPTGISYGGGSGAGYTGGGQSGVEHFSPTTPTYISPETPIIVAPTPDGPMSGGTSTPGFSTSPGHGLIGGGSSDSSSGGLTQGLMAGAGGAAAMGGLKRAASAGGFGRVGGIGSSTAGGIGSSSAGAAGRGAFGSSLTANAGGAPGAGSSSNGLLGARGGGASAGAAAEGMGARGSGTSMAGGGGGAPGNAGSRAEKKGRGLGGPIAPKIDDDDELGPRSENAGAGGR
ncbi:hypothetical protein FHX48_000082 [Microbacterium halimionae]|uniref:Uncharacterized protein n=1 Tax=Microbacterium halimionae TaxID=1526413 RepID=A0A7W3JLF8_9MICO|nr:hypothetical protein [Microbacterium halimionae]MBA8815030.1 hypothetical protein [Microbacterium halimionae]NII94179.1 hypothetical protein [Microbacterium halimionae]